MVRQLRPSGAGGQPESSHHSSRCHQHRRVSESESGVGEPRSGQEEAGSTAQRRCCCVVSCGVRARMLSVRSSGIGLSVEATATRLRICAGSSSRTKVGPAPSRSSHGGSSRAAGGHCCCLEASGGGAGAATHDVAALGAEGLDVGAHGRIRIEEAPAAEGAREASAAVVEWLIRRRRQLTMTMTNEAGKINRACRLGRRSRSLRRRASGRPGTRS